jgi:phospholipid/cholesterol/gamma-HCH transport system substrate-binding protein
MQRYTKLEMSVGAFVIAGGAALAYLALSLGGVHWTTRHFRAHARFSSVGELKVGDAVKLAGVPVGEVERVGLVSFAAETVLLLDDGIILPDDTIASIQSAGLLGDAYVSLSPGASERNLALGGRIQRTEPAVSITELIAKYAFGSPLEEDKGKAGRSQKKDELE